MFWSPTLHYHKLLLWQWHTERLNWYLQYLCWTSQEALIHRIINNSATHHATRRLFKLQRAFQHFISNFLKQARNKNTSSFTIRFSLPFRIPQSRGHLSKDKQRFTLNRHCVMSIITVSTHSGVQRSILSHSLNTTHPHTMLAATKLLLAWQQQQQHWRCMGLNEIPIERDKRTGCCDDQRHRLRSGKVRKYSGPQLHCILHAVFYIRSSSFQNYCIILLYFT